MFLKKVILSRFILEECFPPSRGATDGSFLVLEHIDNNTCKSELCGGNGVSTSFNVADLSL